jgi:hypothetical protein
VLAPLADDDLGFFQAIEDFAVEQFVPQLCSEMPASRHAICLDFPRPIATSIWRSNVAICAALNRFFGMTIFLSKSASNKPLGTKRASQVSMAGCSLNILQNEGRMDTVGGINLSRRNFAALLSQQDDGQGPSIFLEEPAESL